MHILITGGFGFVGGRLAVHLAQAGHQITLGTRHSIGPPGWLPQAEVAKIAWDNEVLLEYCCRGIDVIIHAAGMNAQDCAADPVAALAFNGLATAKLVEAAGKASVMKFIYLSTAHVYASPLTGLITEETPLRNLHPYATSHLAGELAVSSAHSRGKLQGIVLRLSNAFGAPMDKHVNCWMLLVNDLCRQAIQKRILTLQTSGMQQRDFIALTEVCQVVERIILKSKIDDQKNVFNIGWGVSHSVLEMAQLIQKRCLKILGFEPKIEQKKVNQDECHTILTYGTNHLDMLNVTTRSQVMEFEIDMLLEFLKQTSVKELNSDE
jgi:UDP-glucose 4-epimerase